MKEDIDALGVRIERLLGIMKRLSDDNRRLQAELGQSQQQCERMHQRIQEARVRVESALARLPLAGEVQSEETA